MHQLLAADFLRTGRRRRLCQPRFGFGDDLPGDRPGEFRPRRDGDVLHLHRLDAGQCRIAVLGGLRAYAGGLVSRRHDDRTHHHPAGRERSGSGRGRRHHRTVADLQCAGGLDLHLHPAGVSEPVSRPDRCSAR